MVSFNISNGFLKTEKRTGYVIDTNMKKIWFCELQILEKFIDVCNRYNLKYYMAGGSLLGAIRHGGFIPWDDDIDIDMPRKDYKKLASIASYEFKGKFFFQDTYTEENYVRPHAQIRNSNTTAILNHEQGLKFNQGIFIDIFPLDNVPRNIVLRKAQAFLISSMMNFLRAGIMVNPKFNDNLFKNIMHYIAVPFFKVINYRQFFKWYECVVTYFNDNETLKVGEISFDYSDTCIWDKDCFNHVVMKKFEYLEVACPSKYDEILTNTYGDYMIPLKDPSYHGKVFFDCDTPYKTTLKNLYGLDC